MVHQIVEYGNDLYSKECISSVAYYIWVSPRTIKQIWKIFLGDHLGYSSKLVIYSDIPMYPNDPL